MRIFTKEHRKKLSMARKGRVAWNRGLPAPWAKKYQHAFKKGNIPWNKGLKHSPFVIEKMRIAKIGKIGSESNNWRGGRTSRNKHSLTNPEYKKWRASVFQRDNFKCRIANGECSKKIEAHHILNWAEHVELRFQINNGITLCHAHHPRGRAKEKRLAPVFTELVTVSKVEYSVQ